jgi:hypothetical protein
MTALRPVRYSRVRPAVWLLLVFLLHLGMTSACVAEDLTLALTTPAAEGLTDPAAVDDDAPAGKACAHCPCHFAIALPACSAPLVLVVSHPDAAAVPTRVAKTPPAPHLRPPIG